MERYYDKQQKQLIYFENSATPDFWDKHWNVDNFRITIQGYKNNKFILENTRRYLKKGTILEGGCGLGGNVYCLHYNGYSAYGVDFAKNTVAKINNYFPDLNVTVGDVRKLDFENEFFDGYWSLGVIEHFYEGYHEILEEMKRVIKKDGYVFLTFPDMSPLRNFKAKLGLYKKLDDNSYKKDDFYQFALDATSVKKNFEKYGFELEYCKPWDGIKGFKDEVSIIKPILQLLYDYNGKISYVYYFRNILTDFLAHFSGHMMLFIFKKVRN